MIYLNIFFSIEKFNKKWAIQTNTCLKNCIKIYPEQIINRTKRLLTHLLMSGFKMNLKLYFRYYLEVNRQTGFLMKII